MIIRLQFAFARRCPLRQFVACRWNLQTHCCKPLAEFPRGQVERVRMVWSKTIYRHCLRDCTWRLAPGKYHRYSLLLKVSQEVLVPLQVQLPIKQLRPKGATEFCGQGVRWFVQRNEHELLWRRAEHPLRFQCGEYSIRHLSQIRAASLVVFLMQLLEQQWQRFDRAVELEPTYLFLLM